MSLRILQERKHLPLAFGGIALLEFPIRHHDMTRPLPGLPGR
jgi:hypothetical protein